MMTPADATTTHDFSRKRIVITFFILTPDGSYERFTTGDGHAIQATIKHAGLSGGSEADITIEGLSHTDRRSLSVMPDHPAAENLNTTTAGQTVVTIHAGDGNSALTSLFTGTVDRAYTDYDNLNIPFHVHAMTSTIPASILTRTQGYDGPRDTTAILEDICQDAGFQMLDHGGWDRHMNLTNHYRWGTVLDQIQAVLTATKGIFNFSPYAPAGPDGPDTTTAMPYRGLLETWGPAFTGLPATGQDRSLPVISAGTGMIGYPRYSSSGMSLTTLLRPDITFWHPLTLKSALDPTDGSWNGPSPWDGLWLPTFVWHDISSETDRGAWHTHMNCIRTTLGRR
ncbi:hypothetical protein [Bombella mellum]|nr:hypothetical protein [Bombella mellum]